MYVGSFNYFSYTTQIGSNWYIDTGVCDLKVAFFKANSTRFNDICSRDLSNRPIYAIRFGQIYLENSSKKIRALIG